MATPRGTTEIQELILPALANHHGTLFAGQGLMLMAKAAFQSARSLARKEVVMASVSGVDFIKPVPIGRSLTLRAWVSRVGRCSMTVCVTGHTEPLQTPSEDVLKGIFEMVAVDGNGRPTPIEQTALGKEALV